MARLQRRDDAFQTRTELEGVQRLAIGGRNIVDAANIMQPGMLRANAGIIQASGNRMRLGDLAVFILQQIGAVSMQYTRHALGE